MYSANVHLRMHISMDALQHISMDALQCIVCMKFMQVNIDENHIFERDAGQSRQEVNC